MPRGGKREGAGRRAGVPSSKTLARRAIVDKAAAEGITPLEVMLANMRHFHKLAESAEAVLAELSADKIASMPPEEQFKFLLAEVKKAAGLRDMAQECARDAAGYMHPHLASVQHGGNLTVVRADSLADDQLAGIAATGGSGTTEAPRDTSKLN